jgi:hypothetical protein
VTKLLQPDSADSGKKDTQVVVISPVSMDTKKLSMDTPPRNRKMNNQHWKLVSYIQRMRDQETSKKTKRRSNLALAEDFVREQRPTEINHERIRKTAQTMLKTLRANRALKTSWTPRRRGTP